MPKPKKKSDLPVGAGVPYDLLEAAEMLDKNLGYGQTGMYRPMPTGLKGIDVALGGGLHAGDLAVLAGVQNIGKTAAVIQFATSFAESDALVIIVEYEHTVTHVLERLLIQNSFVADTDGHKSFNSDMLHDAYVETIREREEKKIFNDPNYRSFNKLLSRLPNGVIAWNRLVKYQNRIWIVQGDGVVTTPDVLAAYVEMAKQYAPNRRILLIVDYLQRVPVIGKQRQLGQDERVEYIFHYLKSLALRSQDQGWVIPVLGVAAIEAEALRAGRVHMESIIGGAITAYEPDVALIMNKDDRDPDGSPVVRWAIEKNRHGPSDLEWKHKFVGAAYSFMPEGEAVSEENSWQKERKKLQEELSAAAMANAMKEALGTN
ncbi:MAG TPA: hypothetical protein DF364_04570 [Ruminococcaceae bacterium]|nr:hypothetical protein [Oscillospiraceae bacterium]